MANDSGHFEKREDLEAAGGVRENKNIYTLGNQRYVPVYEGKYIFLLDYRYGSFESVPIAKRYGRKATAPGPAAKQLADPNYEIVPRYWIAEELWLERAQEAGLLTDWMLVFRDVAGVYPDLRTAIGAITWGTAAGHKAPLLQLPLGIANTALRAAVFAGLFCSIPFDYIVRNKLFSKSLTFNVLGQIPMPPPRCLLSADREFQPRNELGRRFVQWVVELTYVTHALNPFGKAFGLSRPFTWEPERRFRLLRAVDAASAHAYGLCREDLSHILTRFETLAASEKREYGHFRTAETVLSFYDSIAAQDYSRLPEQSAHFAAVDEAWSGFMAAETQRE
jgi:hypothetical protein